MDLQVEEAELSALRGIPEATVQADPDWITRLASFIDAEFHLLVVRQGERVAAWLPHWVRRRYAVTTAVTPYPFYYTPLILRVPPRKLAHDRMRTGLAIIRALAVELKKRYHRVQLNLLWDTTDIRGFQWEGFEAIPRYTLVSTLERASVDELTPTHRTEFRKAEHHGLEFVASEDADAMVTLMVASYKRQRKQLPLPEPRLREMTRAALGHPSTRLFLTLWDGIPQAGGIDQIDPAFDAAFAWMSGFDSASPCGAGVFSTLNQFLHLKRECKLFDICGANTPLIAQYKSGFGGDLIPFYHVKHSRLRIR
jgi:hypothetical protein